MNTTFDEWEILQAVIQMGGFAAAAEKLHRSQSTVSYAIGRLEEQLGVQLFETKGRKAFLTETGRQLLADAESYLEGFRQLERRALSMKSGGSPEIRLSVDSIYPSDRLFAALMEFSRKFPYVQLKLRIHTFLSADSEFSLHNAQLCLTGLATREFFVKSILVATIVAVAQRNHPLHELRRRPLHADLLQHTLVVVEGMASGILKQQPRLPVQRLLRVSSLDAAIAAIRSGLCFGWVPKYLIQSDLDQGKLAILPLPMGKKREVRINLVRKEMTASSVEVDALAELLGANREPEVI
jgi:DNA-binding transcriptional LysR family regulator